ncbi:MAG: AbrB/MazE/SpoVT family DNA-binding domain-containing protein [Propionibacteriaceae bacterium]|jgi:AbrB family looped-hinge helix DNA binding protein|nr:AbrB/MazE/SpoVT family DNA-binding domain-containing protein [Propionibacteriaceae bacterium]
MSTQLVETAKVLPKGQITIPKDIRATLGVDTGDRVMLVSDGDRIVMMNPATYALEWLGAKMAGKAEPAGLTSEDEVADYITDLRRAARTP